jgi:hypothetical protein
LDGVSQYSALEILTDDMIVFGYSEYARISVYQWDPTGSLKNLFKNMKPLPKGTGSGYYRETKRTVLKTIGCTKKWCIKKIKRNPNVKHQFFCSSRNDLMRVSLDMQSNHRIHPNDIVFRGELDIMDFVQVDSIYIAIMMPCKIFIVD